MIIQPFKSSKMKQLQILFDKAVEATMNASGLSFEEFTTSRSERSVNARVVFGRTRQTLWSRPCRC